MIGRETERGFLVLEWLLVICVVGIFSAVVLPRALSFAYDWAIDYEANRLLGEIRHVQMLARTTQDSLVGDRSGAVRTVPEIQLLARGYRIDGNPRARSAKHSLIPFVRITLLPYGEEAGDLQAIRFGRNGYLETSPLKIRFTVEGRPSVYRQIVLHKSGRSRIGGEE